jgi:DNA polymerase
MPHATKQLAYARLVAERQGCAACPELANPSGIAGGTLDSDRIGPYSRWQGNLDAEVLVVAQDFADVTTFQAVSGWPGPNVKTNTALVALAAAAGIAIAPPKPDCPDDRLFFTNAVLCLKQGNMQASIPRRCFRECGKRFLRPTIALVAPRAVVTLGLAALDATLASFDLPAFRGSLVSLIEAGRSFPLSKGSVLFPMCHPSPTVLNAVRSLDQQRADWARLGRWLTETAKGDNAPYPS